MSKIDEIVEHILKHDGPDENGSGHPKLKQLMCTDLEEAIEKAESKGLSKGFKPYHFKGQHGAWNNDKYVNEFLGQKLGPILKENYDDDMFRLLTETDLEELQLPFIDILNGREVEVSMVAISQKFGNSPYLMLKEYLKLKGLDNEFKDFKPYHVKTTSRSTWDDKDTLYSVLEKKMDQLLITNYNDEEKKMDQLLITNYDDDMFRLLTETDIKKLQLPFIDILNGREVEVKMKGISKKFGDSPYLMLKEYLKLKGLDNEFKDFRPYHAKKTSPGTWDDKETLYSVLEKKMDQLLITNYNDEEKKMDQLLITNYKSDMFKLLTETDLEKLKLPFIDILNGREVEVKMSGISRKFGGSPYLMLKEYLKLKGLDNEFKDFKPYHVKNTSNGTWNDKDTLDSVLEKKMDYLLSKNYEDDMFRLLAETDLEKLKLPFIDILNGREVEVKMGSIVKKFDDSPYLMLKEYLKFKGLDNEFKDFQPYHVKKTSNGTWGDKDTFDSVLKKKMDQLLNTNYKDDMFRLLTETKQKDLQLPFIDILNGRKVEVKMAGILDKFANSPYLILKEYFKLKAIPFPYTKSCFLGTVESRKRRISGELSDFDLGKIMSEDNTYDTSKYGFMQFDGKGKDLTREIITQSYIDHIGEDDVKYLGLESEKFMSLKWFAENLNYDAASSTVIERDIRVHKIMTSLQENATNGLKRTLNGLELINGDFDKKIKSIDKKYNLINFDTCGHMSKDKEKSINTIFDRQLLEDKALFYVTLDNSGLGKSRANRLGFENQIHALHKSIMVASQRNQYTDIPLFQIEYEGGCNGRKRPMLMLGYLIEKDIKSK